MTDSSPDPLKGLLSNFALGPAWARSSDKSDRAPGSNDPKNDRPPRGEGRRGDDNRGRDSRDGRGFNREHSGKGGNRRFQQDRRGGPPHREDIAPAPGVRVTLMPDAQAVHLIGKEVHQVARVYPLFDVAQILLAERARCRALFETEESKPAFYRGKLDESLFLTREEALRHLWQSDLRQQLLDEETIEVDPPTGNFQSVARCGISGEWLGPPNFHSYQTNLRRLHRERFANMPFEAFASKVRTERGEEAVNAWLETTRQKNRWRLKDAGDEAPWIDDRSDAERALAGAAFEKAFAETRKAEISAAIPAKNLSPALLATLRIAASHARKHPAILIPAICRALEAEHLPVFKRQGKLHTGPARPHGLAPDAILAERPGIMVKWIRENTPAKLAGLWEAVLPEGSTAPPADYAADLFWLLQQGHILLFTDDTLVVQELREPAPPKEGKKKKSKGPKPAPSSTEGEAKAAPLSTPEGAASTEATEAPTTAPAEPTAAAAAAEPEAPSPAADPEEIPANSSPVIDPAPEAEPAPEATPEPGSPAAGETPTAGQNGLLPDSDFAEPSEQPQSPEANPSAGPETSSEETPSEQPPSEEAAPEGPEQDGKLPDSDFSEPSEAPQKPE